MFDSNQDFIGLFDGQEGLGECESAAIVRNYFPSKDARPGENFLQRARAIFARREEQNDSPQWQEGLGGQRYA